MLLRISFEEILIFLMTVRIIAGTNKEIFQVEENNESFRFIKCFNITSEINEISFKTTFVIYEDNIFDDNTTDAFTHLFIENQMPFIRINIKEDLLKLTNFYEGTMLIISYYTTCEDILNIDLSIFYIKFKYIIITDSYVDKECVQAIEQVLSPVLYYDITFLTKDHHNTDIYKLATLIPQIDEHTCNVAKIAPMETINVCLNGTLEKNKITDIFPIKTPSNFKKCDFNVGMATLFPYSMLDKKELYKDLDPVNDKCYGADIEYMKIFANVLNATLKMYYIFREEENPYLRSHFLEYLFNGTLDACAGGLYRIYGDVVAYSGVYSAQSVIWIYTVEREIRSWQSLIVKITGLYIFFIFYICYTVLWKLMNIYDKRSDSIQDTLIHAWGALMGTSGLQEARSLKHKILNVVYLIMCIHLASYIGTQIYYYLTIEQPPQTFKTVDELALSDRTPYLRYLTKYFIDEKKHKAFANTSRDCDHFKDCERAMLEHNGSTIIINGQLPPLQAATSVNDEARVLSVPQEVLFIYHEMLMRKDHLLVTKFDKITSRLFEAGICHKLYIDAIGITVVDRARIANENILSNSYSCIVGCQITLRESAGAFYIWIFGCALSCCVFVIEILLKRKLKKRSQTV